MCVCMCVCLYMCLCVYMCVFDVRVYVCMYAFVHVCVSIYASEHCVGFVRGLCGVCAGEWYTL